MSKKLGYIIGGALIAVGVLTLIFIKPEPVVPEKVEVVRPARVYTVRDSGARETRTFPGVVEGADRVPLSFRVGGTLAALPAKEGFEVEMNDVVARLDTRDFQSRLAAAEGRLAAAKSQLVAMETGERDEVIRTLEAQVRAAKATYDESVAEFARQSQLFEKNIISKSQLARYELRTKTDKEKLEAAEQELHKGRSGARQEDIDAQTSTIRSLEAEVKAAGDALKDTTLRTPFSGRITKRYVENFEEVRPGQAIVELQALDQIELSADIPEALVALVRREWVEGFYVRFDFGEDTEYKAQLVEMAMTADRRTSTYRLTVAIPQPGTVKILPGMTGSLLVKLNQAFQEGMQGHLVPSNAVFADEAGNPLVWKLNAENRVQRTEITLGEAVGDMIIVQSGVDTGDIVVTAGVNYLEEDQQVRRLEQASN